MLADGNEVFNPREADTAIFYAINNCRAALVGISFGYFLIKQVVVELAHEMPNLKTFATLSPKPRLRSWFATLGHDTDTATSVEETEALAHISVPSWHQDKEIAEHVRKPLMRLCARYLLKVGSDGRPLTRSRASTCETARFSSGSTGSATCPPSDYRSPPD